eukprot:UC1_evm1s1313
MTHADHTMRIPTTVPEEENEEECGGGGGGGGGGDGSGGMEAGPGGEFHIFLGYQPETEGPFVRLAYQELETCASAASRLSCFLDQYDHDPEPGVENEVSLAAEMRSCRVYMPVLSEQTIELMGIMPRWDTMLGFLPHVHEAVS